MWSDPFNFTDLTSYTWFLGHYAPGTPAILIFPKHFSSAPVSVVFDLQIATWLIATLPSYQFSSVAQSCPTLCDPMNCSTPGFLSITNSQSLLKLTSITSVMSSNHLILRHPLLLLSSVFPGIRVFSSESVLRIYWPKYWSFSFSISPSNEYSWLISFRIDRLDLPAVQGALKSLLQHHSSKASILWLSAFFSFIYHIYLYIMYIFSFICQPRYHHIEDLALSSFSVPCLIFCIELMILCNISLLPIYLHEFD